MSPAHARVTGSDRDRLAVAFVPDEQGRLTIEYDPFHLPLANLVVDRDDLHPQPGPAAMSVG